MSARCWTIGEKYGPFGAFFLSLLKLDRKGDKSRDDVAEKGHAQRLDASRGNGWLICRTGMCDPSAHDNICATHVRGPRRRHRAFFEKHENLASTVEGRNTVLAQEDLDDINSASSDRLSRDLGEMWRSVIIPDNISEEEGSATSSTFSSEESFEYHEHNLWNSLLDAVSLCGWCCVGSTPRRSSHGENCSCVPFPVGSIV